MNTTHPALHEYTGPTTGWFAFIHHDQLYEWSGDIRTRVKYVGAFKPPHELPTRRRCLMALTANTFPPGKLRDRLAESTCFQIESAHLRTESTRLRAESGRLQAEGDRLRAEGNLLWARSNLLRAESNRLRDESHALLARDARLWASHSAAVEVTIRALIPNCPWNGKTLFPQ